MLKFTSCHLMQFPSGTWGFVGKVPVSLLFADTPERIAEACNAGCTQFLKRKVFQTEAEAQAALDAYNNATKTE